MELNLYNVRRSLFCRLSTRWRVCRIECPCEQSSLFLTAAEMSSVTRDAQVSSFNAPCDEMPTLPLDVVECIALAADPATAGRMAQCCSAWKRRLSDNDAVRRERERLSLTCTILQLSAGGGVITSRLPSGERHGPSEWRNANEVLLQLEHYERGKLHGSRRGWNDKGVLMMWEQYEHGELHGTRKYWNDQGVRTKRQHYVRGELHGTSKRWNCKGDWTVKEHHEHGKYHGTQECRNDQGVRTLMEHLEHGERHGTRAYWNAQGVCTRMRHYEHGKRHGSSMYWNDQGVLLLEKHYEHGELIERSV